MILPPCRSRCMSRSYPPELQSKLDNLALTIAMRRLTDDATQGDLESACEIKYQENRYGLPPELTRTFQIRYDNSTQRWQVVEPTRSSEKELKTMVDFHYKIGYSRDAICRMIGIGKSALAEKLKKAREK